MTSNEVIPFSLPIPANPHARKTDGFLNLTRPSWPEIS
jgi:hypothetical protein